MSDVTTSPAEARSNSATKFNAEHSRGLLLVGLFKLGKALFFGVLAAGVFHMVHSNLGDVVQRFVDSHHEAIVRFDPEGKLVNIVLDKADTVSNHKLRMAGMLSFGYACVCIVEGIGLLKRKVWAEYFTIVLTAGALPWEALEMYRRFTWFKVGFMVLNVLVLLYLLYIVRRMRARQASGQ